MVQLWSELVQLQRTAIVGFRAASIAFAEADAVAMRGTKRRRKIDVSEEGKVAMKKKREASASVFQPTAGQ